MIDNHISDKIKNVVTSTSLAAVAVDALSIGCHGSTTAESVASSDI